MTMYLQLLVALIGLLLYVLSSNPKLAEVGRILLFAGVLAFLLSAPAHLVSLLR